MTKVNAFAAFQPGSALETFEYELGPIEPDQVDITVESCGICHADISMLENAWGMTQYPFVPGHEIIGTVSAVGGYVSHLEVGDVVGLGWHAGYCMACSQCLNGDHNLCINASCTIVGRHGGFADIVRAKAASVIKLPQSINPRSAGPLMCGGIAVFNPLLQYEILPSSNIGVIGIGGLGHLALRFLRAWGCRVTAFTSNEAKHQDAICMGADDTLTSNDEKTFAANAGYFDLIISTVTAKLDWNQYITMLKPRGRLHFLGVVVEPLELNMVPMLFSQLSVSASPVGSPAAINTMMEFAGRHGIEPRTERFPMSQVNDAIEHLRAGNARYRIVLDRN